MEPLVDRKEFKSLCDKTIPLTRWLRVLDEGDLCSRGIDHDVSLMVGEERPSGRTWIVIIRPRWQMGHSRKECPVSLSYRSR